MGAPEWGGIYEINGYNVHSVNTDVPYAIIFTGKQEIVIDKIAPKIRYAPVFPEGTNVNFVKVESKSELTIRTYERGVGAETLSCGAGAIVSIYVAHRLGMAGDRGRRVHEGVGLRGCMAGRWRCEWLQQWAFRRSDVSVGTVDNSLRDTGF